MLYRALSTIGSDLPSGGDLVAYPDGAQVSDWAKEAMTALARSGILKGSDDKELAPSDLTTVEQAILLVLRASESRSGAAEVAWLDLPHAPSEARPCTVVRQGEDYILTDQAGNELVPAGTYDFIGQPVGGLLDVRKTEKTEPYPDPFYGLRETRGLWGLIDSSGAVAAPLDYDRVWTTTDALIPVQKGSGTGGIGFLDQTGKEVVPCVFSTYDLTVHGGGYVGQPKPDFIGVEVDNTGKVTGLLGDWQSGYTPVRGEHGLWGYADQTGALVTKQEYESVSCISQDGLALVKKGGVYGLLRLW